MTVALSTCSCGSGGEGGPGYVVWYCAVTNYNEKASLMIL